MSVLETPVGKLRIESCDGDHEGWVCVRCDDGYPIASVTHLVFEGDGPNGDPVCYYHKDEAIHDITPYGRNCPRCGVQHPPLWPTDEDTDVVAWERWTD